jgi:ssDNA-binding Zn-finger/Zn-ribbon topoisomerase 1
MADESLPRETGSEKAAECPECGTEVPAVETKYGSVARGACPNCSGTEQLEAQKAAAEAKPEAGASVDAPAVQTAPPASEDEVSAPQ